MHVHSSNRCTNLLVEHRIHTQLRPSIPRDMMNKVQSAKRVDAARNGVVFNKGLRQSNEPKSPVTIISARLGFSSRSRLVMSQSFTLQFLAIRLCDTKRGAHRTSEGVREGRWVDFGMESIWNYILSECVVKMNFNSYILTWNMFVWCCVLHKA